MSDPERKSLRIGILAPGYPSGEAGDYRGIFVQQLVQHLKARGHRVCVVTSAIRPQDRPFVRIDEAKEIHRFKFWSEGKLLAEYQKIPVARMLTYIASALLAGRRNFSRSSCDLIHSHFLMPTGLIGAALAQALGKPHVLSVHGSDMRLVTRKKFLRPLARWTLRHCQAVTATANHQLAGLASLGVPAETIIKMPMGIHQAFLGDPWPEGPAALDPDRNNEDHPDNPRKKMISTRTLMETPYNVSQLIRAMRLVVDQDPAITCTIAGEGPDRTMLEALTGQLGLTNHISFVGWSDADCLAQALRRHRFYISTSRADGASISLFEAMVSGAYPLVSDIPANREWIRHGENGLLFPLDDPQAMARIMIQAINDPEAVQHGARANRETALQTCTWPAIAIRLEKIYYQALDH